MLHKNDTLIKKISSKIRKISVDMEITKEKIIETITSNTKISLNKYKVEKAAEEIINVFKNKSIKKEKTFKKIEKILYRLY